MSTSTPDPKLNVQIYQEACEWLIAFRTEVPDAISRGRLDAWLRKSPEHVRAYLEVAAIWEDAALHDPQHTVSSETHIARSLSEDSIVPFGRSASREADADPNTRILSDAQTRGLEVLNPSVPTSRNGGNARPPAYAHPQRGWRVRAAIVAPLAAIASIFFWLQFHSGVYATEVGEQRSIALADGSVIELNARSRVRVRLSRSERDVDLLQGQALFQVAPDSSRPFIVRSGAAAVRAVGTQFDVYRRKSGTTVTVIEGRVAVYSNPHAQPLSSNEERSNASNEAQRQAVRGSSSGRPSPVSPSQVDGNASPSSKEREGPVQREGEAGSTAPPSVSAEGLRVRTAGQDKAAEDDLQGTGAVFVTAGEQVTVLREAVAQPTRANIATATAWTQRRLIFDSAPLSEVVEEFNRYNTRQLVIDDSGLENFAVIGVFSSTDPGSLLRFLRAQPRIMVVEDDTHIRITRKSLR